MTRNKAAQDFLNKVSGATGFIPSEPGERTLPLPQPGPSPDFGPVPPRPVPPVIDGHGTGEVVWPYPLMPDDRRGPLPSQGGMGGGAGPLVSQGGMGGYFINRGPGMIPEGRTRIDYGLGGFPESPPGSPVLWWSPGGTPPEGYVWKGGGTGEPRIPVPVERMDFPHPIDPSDPTWTPGGWQPPTGPLGKPVERRTLWPDFFRKRFAPRTVRRSRRGPSVSRLMRPF